MDNRLAVDPTEQVYAEIRRAFDLFNTALFDGTLPPCVLTLQREKKTYGYFSSQRFGSLDGRTADEIALNPEFFAVVPQLEVLQTLAHEMAHLWQAHHGTPGRGRYHNKEWADKMEAIGLMPSSTGAPGGSRTGDHMADYMIEGGRFAEVADQFLGKEGRRITWFDRFAARPVLYASTSIGSMAGLPAQAAVVPVQLEECQAIVKMVGALGAASSAETTPSRIKYSCPDCGINAWGKPGLRLGCMACAQEMPPAPT